MTALRSAVSRIAIVGFALLLVIALVITAYVRFVAGPHTCVIVNRTGGAITNVELIGNLDADPVRIDRLAPDETRRVAPPRGEGFGVAFTDDGGRWSAGGCAYVALPGTDDVVVPIGPDRKVNGQSAERMR